jgi:hypothetical protein
LTSSKISLSFILMRLKRAFRFLLMSFLAFGCGPEFDRDAARKEIEAQITETHQEWFKVLEGPESDSLTTDSIPGPAAQWLCRLWRIIDSEAQSPEIAFRKGDTLADVTVVTELSGEFSFELKDPNPRIVEKGLLDQAATQALFHCDPSTDIWALAEISFTEVISDTMLAPEVNLREVMISTAALNKTISDPWALFPPDSLPKLLPGDSVLVQLITEVDTTRCLALLYSDKKRLRFRPDGLTKDGWVAEFTAPTQPGLHRLVVDLINLQTIFDERYPYNSNRWIIPYRVEEAE